MKFKVKLVSRIKELREELNMQQQELANLLGVSRQTIYYLEKGTYNPKLTLSFKIAQIFNRPIEKIFYPEPIIKNIIGKTTLDELKDISRELDMDITKIMDLSDINNKELEENYLREELIKICNGLRVKYDDLFES